jgi:hypothetical protein
MPAAQPLAYVISNLDSDAPEGLVIYPSVADAVAAEEKPKRVRYSRAVYTEANAREISRFAQQVLAILSDVRPAAFNYAARQGLFGVTIPMPVQGEDGYEELAGVYTEFTGYPVIGISRRLIIAGVDVDVEVEIEAEPEPAEVDELYAALLAEELQGAGQPAGRGARADNVAPLTEPVLDALESILSRYMLYGEPEPVIAAEAAPAPVMRIPWAEFTPGPPRNCLVEGLVAKYSDPKIPANRRLSRAAIEEAFAKTGPSLEALHAFAVRYRIPLRVYDISGAEVFACRNVVGSDRGPRAGLGVLAYNGHAYFRNDSIAKDLQLHKAMVPEDEHDVAPFIDTRCGAAEDAAAKEIQAKFFEWAPLNKSWAAEKHLGARALSYSSEDHVCDDGCGCGRVAWDMTKAYYTAVKHDFSHAGVRAATAIPCFTAVDDWQTLAEERAKFPSRSAWVKTYFLVSKGCLARWADSGVAYLMARKNNLLTGAEYEYLLARGFVSADDVEAWKTATESIPTGRFEHFIRRGDGPIPDAAAMKHMTVLARVAGAETSMAGEVVARQLATGAIDDADVLGWTQAQRSFGAFLDEIDAPATPETDGLTRAQFSTYYGIYGRTSTSGHSLLVGAPPLDAELLRLTHSRVETVGEATRVELSRPRELLLNSRTTYDYIVSTAALVMMKFIDDVLEANPGARVLQLRTDSAAFDRAVALPAWARPIFHREEPRLRKQAGGAHYLDHSAITAGVVAEVATLAERMVGYVGAPGTGKTHAVKSEHTYDAAMAFSNVTARNLDTVRDGVVHKGVTLDEGLRLKTPAELSAVVSKARGKTWWIDELSTIRAGVWSVIVEVASRGLEKLILTGDPDQIPPVAERFRHESHLIRAILGRAQRLTRDWRNDAGLVAMREKIRALYAHSQAPVEDPAAFIQGLFAEHPEVVSSEADIAAANVHVTYTRATAAKINRWVADRRGLRFTKEAAGWSASAGVRLRCCENYKDQGALNGDVFEVVEAVEAGKPATLRPIDFDLTAPQRPNLVVPAKMLGSFELGWAFTTHSTIGVTVRGQRLVVYEAERMVDVDPQILYTAVTRACSAAAVAIERGVPAYVG